MEDRRYPERAHPQPEGLAAAAPARWGKFSEDCAHPISPLIAGSMLPPTPCLVLDLDALERNIVRMADHAKRHGIALQPHAKTHKSRAIASLQVQHGAVGI